MCLIDLPAAFVIAAVRAFGVNADRQTGKQTEGQIDGQANRQQVAVIIE